MLQFKLAHANARDAVYAVLEQQLLLNELQTLQLPAFLLHSFAGNQHEYLQSPDRGRRLNDESVGQLKEFNSTGYDVCFVVADDLSATAINNHAVAVLKLLLPRFEK